MSTPDHWNRIFSAKADPELGWYERDAARTLEFLDAIPDLDRAAVFLPGAGTSVLADALHGRCGKLVLNDISSVALDKLRERLGDGPDLVWHAGDVSAPLPGTVPPLDLWIDRAVLHFLLDDAQIRGYFDNLRSRLKPGGHALFAEFAPDGALRCAGLDVRRYATEDLAARLGPGFELLRGENTTFINPAGSPRPYTYALFRRALH